MKKNTANRIRTALLASLKRDVAELVRQDNIDALLETLNGTGYDHVGGDCTSREIGRAIMALATLLDDVEDLACVVQTAAVHRHKGVRVGSTPHDGMMRELAEHRANATLDRAGPGVLARWLLRMNTERADFEAAAPTSAEVH